MSIHLTKTETPKVVTSAYTLSCLADRPYVRLEDARGRLLCELFAPSSIHTLGAQDDTTALGAWRVEEREGEVILSLEPQSSFWTRKTCRFRCREERLSYEIELEGSGRLLEAQYFGGYLSAIPRWGSGFFWSRQAFEEGFNPEPYTDETYAFAPAEGSLLDLAGVPIAGKGSWFFTPTPYQYAFRKGEGWLGLGVEAVAGQNTYTDFRYHGQRDGFYLSLAYEGYTGVSGRYTLPSIAFDFASTPYEAIARHAEALRRQGYAPGFPPEAPPDWWLQPIFCGWGSQCYLASFEKGRAPDYATQANYEGFLGGLEHNGVNPGTVVLDDKWQKTYGDNEADAEKWPDLPGFIASQHEAGRKVLLWLKAWDPEGKPPEECVRNAAGVKVAVDPTNPIFEARFRRAVRRMLLDYDADGFKLDFTARIPSGPGLELYEEVWGLELLKRYLGILYSEAKSVKASALVMTHTPHPYLGDVTDMIRLNDINTAHAVVPAMRHRERVARSALPGHLIDTDNWPMANRSAWRSYLEIQAELGVPSLYYASHIDATGEALEKEDYRLIRDVWQRYRDGLSSAEGVSAKGDLRREPC